MPTPRRQPCKRQYRGLTQETPMEIEHGDLDASPLLWADMDTVRESIAELEAEGRATACLTQIIGFAVSTLEGAALVAQARGDSYLFSGRMSVEAARQRAKELRAIPLV